MARPAGFEPTTLGFGGQYSDPLSYGRFQVKIIPLSHSQAKDVIVLLIQFILGSPSADPA